MEAVGSNPGEDKTYSHNYFLNRVGSLLFACFSKRYVFFPLVKQRPLVFCIALTVHRTLIAQKMRTGSCIVYDL